MGATEEIIKMAKENNGTVTTAMVVAAGISRGNIKYLVDKGMIEKSARGVYILPEVWDDEIFNLQSRFKRGIYSHETALFLWNLTDRTPNRYYMTFPANYNLTKPKEENIRCVQCKEALYDLGVVEVLTPGGNTVKAYSVERTLCDILRPHSHVDIQVVTEAFKRYATRMDKNIPLLSEYAKTLKVEKKLRASGGVVMKNAMQLKAIIKNLAKEKHISAQLVMQNFMLERLLERISISKYQQNFILKGGFLIAAMVGLDTRATMDMDATIKGLPVNEQTVREGDVYTGYRVSLSANYPPMAVPLKLDITTGDKITPKEIEYQFKLLLEDRSISVLAYNLETIMAEKLETVISRGDQNTRPRDYYDIYILAKLQYANIEPDALGAALNATTEKRGSSTVVKEYRSIMDTVKSSEVMQKQWKNYQKDFEYATDIALEDACDVVVELMENLGGE